MGHAAFNFYTQVGNIRELDRVVRIGRDGLAQIQADLGVDHIEGSRELNVMDVIPAQIDVHQAGDRVGFTGVFIELDALHQRGGAVSYTDDCHTYFLTLLFSHLTFLLELGWIDSLAIQIEYKLVLRQHLPQKLLFGCLGPFAMCIQAVVNGRQLFLKPAKGGQRQLLDIGKDDHLASQAGLLHRLETVTSGT